MKHTLKHTLNKRLVEATVSVEPDNSPTELEIAPTLLVNTVETIGTDPFVTLSKVTGDNPVWMQTTRAMTVPGGVVLQITTLTYKPDFEYAVTESHVFVPGAMIGNRDGQPELVRL